VLLSGAQDRPDSAARRRSGEETALEVCRPKEPAGDVFVPTTEDKGGPARSSVTDRLLAPTKAGSTRGFRISE
jgi:hypothetical protein